MGIAIGIARTFLRGLTAGALGTLLAGAVLLFTLKHFQLVSFPSDHIPIVQHWLDWTYVNLGASIPVFLILLLTWFFGLRRLRTYLEEDEDTNRIVQLDHLTDIWTALFFGTGVIWTAIGMRSALIFALGDPETSVQEGAFAILDRMVSGGILLALSTTIFGGIGGYLMRVYKVLTLGAKLQQHYDHAARSDTSAMRESLYRIERRLQHQAGDGILTPRANDE